MNHKCEVCGRPTNYEFITHWQWLSESGEVIHKQSEPHYYCEEHQPHKEDWIKNTNMEEKPPDAKS